MILKISEIKIGQRVRDDCGDMEALATSIQEHGLLHPIVVDSGYNLIAGCRRLLACERIGLKEIEVKVLEGISEKKLRVLELEENIKRKDLTSLEKSKNLVELAEIKEKELTEKEFRAESAQNLETCKSMGGRPSKVTSLRKVSEELGVPTKTLHDAKQHVKAVEEFPQLEELPKHQAIETVKELRRSTPEEQEKILNFAQRKSETLSAKKEDDFCAYMDECAKVLKKYHKAMGAFMWIKADENEFNMLSEAIGADTAQSDLQEVEESIAKLTRLRTFLKGVLQDGKTKSIRT